MVFCLLENTRMNRCFHVEILGPLDWQSLQSCVISGTKITNHHICHPEKYFIFQHFAWTCEQLQIHNWIASLWCQMFAQQRLTFLTFGFFYFWCVSTLPLGAGKTQAFMTFCAFCMFQDISTSTCLIGKGGCRHMIALMGIGRVIWWVLLQRSSMQEWQAHFEEFSSTHFLDSLQFFLDTNG